MMKRCALVLALFHLSACANQVGAARSVLGNWFSCEDGLAFSAEPSADRVLIVMSDGRRFELKRAPTSIGELFRSADTTLRIDEDFAVLAGSPVHDYTRCRQMARDA